MSINIMKIIPFPTVGVHCYSCNIAQLICTNSAGNSYDICPVCDSSRSSSNHCDDYNTVPSIIKKILTYDDNECINYCPDCDILFQLSCKHAENGCTSDVYFTDLVESICIDDKLYEGMPVFDTDFECNNMKINWKSTCTGLKCSRASYSDPKHYSHDSHNKTSSYKF